MATIPPNAQRVFSGKIFDVYQWPQPLFDGSIATFEVAKRLDFQNTFFPLLFYRLTPPELTAFRSRLIST